MDISYGSNIENENQFAGYEIDEQMIAEGERRTAQFLFRSLGVIKSSCLSAPVLRSSYLLRLKSLETAVYSKQSAKHCQFCYQPWSEGCFTLKVLPKRTPGKCVRKIMKKKLINPSKLSKYERSLLKKIENNVGNKLVLKCLKCRKDTVKKMRKCDRITTTENKIVKTKKKNKCKQKDYFAGLNSQVVMNSGVFKKEKLGASNVTKINKRGDNPVVGSKGSSQKKYRRENSFLMRKDEERRMKVDQCNLKRTQIIKKIRKIPQVRFANGLKDFLRDFKETCESKIRTEIEKNIENNNLTDIIHSQMKNKKGKGKRGGNSSLGTKKKKKRKTQISP